MIKYLENKRICEIDCGTHVTVLDGPILGGCGRGEVGDPNTYLPALWQDVIDKHGIKSVLDVGCGYGYSTKWFQDRGLEVQGIEGSTYVVERAESANIDVHDFREGRMKWLDKKYAEFDLGWCSEFLEHVRAEYEPCYMHALAKCKHLLISAATPGFRGHHHVNEQPSEYWIERFQRYGFEFDQDETNRLRHLSHEVNPSCYFQGNGLFFRRAKEAKIRAHWTDVDGPLSPDEADRIQDLARGQRVLLVSDGEGRTALALAETAKSVTLTCGGEFWDLGCLLENVRRARMDSKIEVVEDSIDAMASRRFDMVVIESIHSFATNLAAKVILPGGHIVWGGWDRPEIRGAVESAGVRVADVQPFGNLGILETARWRVNVVLPHSRGVELQSYKSMRMASIGRFTTAAVEMDMDCGCLPHNFNSLLAQSLDWRDRGQCTHLAMIHSDITAERGWLDLLAEEMHTHGLVAISAVVAIKDPDQDRTSTAIGSKSEPWSAKRYIHLRHHGQMPTTFTGKDVCQDDDEVLLINTGLMLLDLRHEFWDTFCFQVPTTILKIDGKRAPAFRPEDWEMSRELDRAGLPYGATWRPVVEHLGGSSWTNRPGVRVLNNA